MQNSMFFLTSRLSYDARVIGFHTVPMHSENVGLGVEKLNFMNQILCSVCSKHRKSDILECLSRTWLVHASIEMKDGSLPLMAPAMRTMADDPRQTILLRYYYRHQPPLHYASRQSSADVPSSTYQDGVSDHQ